MNGDKSMNYVVLKNIFQVIYITAGLLTFANTFLWIGLRMCKKYKTSLHSLFFAVIIDTMRKNKVVLICHKGHR